MIARAALALALAGAPAAALAQEHQHGMTMPGMSMPGMSPPAAEDKMGSMPPPPAPQDRAADRYYPADRMAAARDTLAREHGGMAYHLVMANIAEWQVRDGRDGYRWEGEGWYGGDIDRLAVKSEGEGSFGRSPEDAEVQALFSHAVDPYWNLQGGVRQDLAGPAKRTWASVAVEGLAPYWFKVEGTAFLSTHGELAGRLTTYYDQRITQSLVLQPRAELNLAAQRSAARREGSGLVSADLDLRLRYEFAREFAPYLGVSYRRLSGATARYARAAGERAGSTSLVLGVRAWF